MKYLIPVLLILTGCASTPRTKWTDKTMRVLIDPDSIDANNYVRIQQALVASGKWTVIDRAMGFNAIEKEQERLHRTEGDRFDDREKWAIWGRLFGVGGIIVSHAQCQMKTSFFGANYIHCNQNLAIMDANTGEVIAAVSNDEDGDRNEESIAPSWEDTVSMLNDAYPAHFKANKDSKILDDYRELSKEEAQRQRERNPAGGNVGNAIEVKK